jgi:hypothetical protein
MYEYAILKPVEGGEVRENNNGWMNQTGYIVCIHGNLTTSPHTTIMY